jgi:CheY-like chemotaxis protein
LVREAKANDWISATPPVLLTPNPRQRACRQARAEGFIVLAKPVRRERLLAAVAGQLDRSADEDPGRRLKSVARNARRAAQRRVLVAEDSAINQKVVLKMLKLLDYEAEAVPNGLEAVRRSEGGGCAVVLMDCQMPEVDGYEATRRIREREGKAGIRLPIVALAAHGMQGDRERCLEAGMDDYLSKPLQFEELAAALERWSGVSAIPQPSAAAP